MAENDLPPSDDPIPDPRPPETEGKTTIGRRPGRAKAGAKGKGQPAPDVTQPEARGTFYAMFSGLAKLLRSDVQFAESDFDGLAKSVITVGKKFPPLLFVMAALLPFQIVLQLADKVLAIREGVNRRRQREATGEAQNIVNYPGGHNAGTGTTGL